MNFHSFKNKYQKIEPLEFSNSTYTVPLVSVCIQTYQHVNFIEECLEGVLMQRTDFSFEILLGEDDSYDGTREICLTYKKKYPDKIRLFLHHRANNIKIGGKPTGRFNFLYNMFSARGKYIALCEGDDYWTDPLKLQKQVDFLDNNSEYIAHAHNSYFIDETVPSNKTNFFSCLPSRKVVFDDICPTRTFHTATIIFRQTSIMNWVTQFLVQKVQSGDKYLFMYLFLEGNIYYEERPLSVYRRNAGGMSKSSNLNLYMDSDIDMYEYFKNKADKILIPKLSEAVNYYKVERYVYILDRKISFRLFLYYTTLVPLCGRSRHLPYSRFKKLTKLFLNKLFKNG
ncbi:glycosyltransferase family 2 protein [Christiangramia marina]|uniref:glycosyltransferase family 2 protein n=1 Tax=Christiangramia marina TaxID=409436 RepID=UPI003AA8BA42